MIGQLCFTNMAVFLVCVSDWTLTLAPTLYIVVSSFPRFYSVNPIPCEASPHLLFWPLKFFCFRWPGQPAPLFCHTHSWLDRSWSHTCAGVTLLFTSSLHWGTLSWSLQPWLPLIFTAQPVPPCWWYENHQTTCPHWLSLEEEVIIDAFQKHTRLLVSGCVAPPADNRVVKVLPWEPDIVIPKEAECLRCNTVTGAISPYFPNPNKIKALHLCKGL